MLKRIVAATIVGVFAVAATPAFACGGKKADKTSKKAGDSKKTASKKGAKQV